MTVVFDSKYMKKQQDCFWANATMIDQTDVTAKLAHPFQLALPAGWRIEYMYPAEESGMIHIRTQSPTNPAGMAYYAICHETAIHKD